MALFDSPFFTYPLLIVLVVLINFFPHFIAEEESRPWRIGLTLVASIFFIIGYLIVLWSLTNEFFIIFVVVFAFSYAHFCSILKKSIRLKFYTIIFLIVSLFFILWTTAMFGKYYMENELINVNDYISQYNAIIDLSDWFPIMDFKLSILFFNISFKNYFILPDDVSLKNPFFIQFILGIIISGTIISWIIDVIKYFVTPSNPK